MATTAGGRGHVDGALAAAEDHRWGAGVGDPLSHVTREGPYPDGQIATVLVADDELHIVDLLASIAEELGHTVIRAGNGEQALRAILEHLPSLVLTDVMMPRLRGDELCRRVKASPETAWIAVVLLTSLPPGNFDEHGADAYIAKPFAIEQVEVVVARFLSSGGVRGGRATDV